MTVASFQLNGVAAFAGSVDDDCVAEVDRGLLAVLLLADAHHARLVRRGRADQDQRGDENDEAGAPAPHVSNADRLAAPHAGPRRHDHPAARAGAARRRDADCRAAATRRDPRLRGLRLPRGLRGRLLRRLRSSAASRARGSGSARCARARRRRSRSRCAAASSSARGRSAPDFVRRFVESAAESGIDVFRLHDPLNDVSNLREAGEAITAADREFDAGLVYSPGPSGETDALVAQAQRLPELGAARVLVHDPSGALEPHRVRELIEAIREASGLPVGLYCQGAGGSALAAGIEAARAGADLIAAAVYPVALVLHRASGESIADALDGLGFDTERRHARPLGRGRPRRRAHQRPAGAAARAAHRHARGAAQPSGRARRRARPPPPRRTRPATASTR